jgi:glycosyltransferase involved in cell wall biosynthesis
VPNPLLIFRLARWIADAEPDAVQTWMYHADIFGGAAARLARLILRLRRGRQSRFPLVWGVHRSEIPANLGARLKFLARTGAITSAFLPDSIVCCADAAFNAHAAHGYARDRMRVIHNGFDITRFAPNPVARDELNQMLGLKPDAIVVGIVGRYNPAKDYDNFVNAAALVHERVPQCAFVMIGKDIDAKNETLVRHIAEKGLSGACHLLGPRDNPHTLMPAFDMLCLSSRTEGLPTVVGEAMACGVPCVVTDVGDTAQLVGDTGFVVPPRDAARLADALTKMAQLDAPQRRALGERARARIVDSFSIAVCWDKYRQLYASFRADAPARGARRMIRE